MLKPGVLLIYKTPKVGQWVGTVLLHCCELIERPSKKDGFCFKLFHPLDQSVWAVKVPQCGPRGSGGPGEETSPRARWEGAGGEQGRAVRSLVLGPRSRGSRTGLTVPRVSHSVAGGSEVVSGLPCGTRVGVRGSRDLGTRWVQITRRALSRGWGTGPCEGSCSRPRPPPSEPGGSPAQDQSGQVAR